MNKWINNNICYSNNDSVMKIFVTYIHKPPYYTGINKQREVIIYVKN